MISADYTFTPPDFTTLLLRKFYPERTDKESVIMRDYLLQHLAEFDRISFSVRVGAGATPDAAHPKAIQDATVFSSRKRIDMLAWRGQQPVIIEVKDRIQTGALGQLLGYRHLLLEEHPEWPDPELIAIGRYADDETVRILTTHNVTVYLYDQPNAQ